MRNTLAVLLLASLANAGTNCGPFQCYPESCQQGSIPVDFLFVVDVSGSMFEEIGLVKNAMNQFVESLADQQIDGAFAIMEMASNPGRLRLNNGNMMNSAQVVSRFNQIGTSGGYENTLEGVLIGTGEAPVTYGTSGTSLRTPPWRPEAKRRVIMVFTDEDSDPPSSSAARDHFGFPGGDRQKCWDANWTEKKYFSEPDLTAYRNAYQAEVDAVADALSNSPGITYSFYGFIKSCFHAGYDGSCCVAECGESCGHFLQFGRPQDNVQDPDFRNFNKQQTITKLQQSGYTQSLQYQLLQNGVTARLFDVLSLTNGDVARNFFEAIVADTAVCDECKEYKCETFDNQQCADERWICDCAGTPYGSATVDCNGDCQGTAYIDCLGLCVGGNTGRSPTAKDKCGVCSATPAPNAHCKEDCNGDFYLLRTFTGQQDLDASESLACPTGAELAGLIAMNQDLYNAWISAPDVEATACVWWKTYGQFESRQGCTFSAGYAGGPSAFLQSLAGAPFPGDAACEANSKHQYPGNARTNECGDCLPTDLSTFSDFCEVDCNGVAQSDPNTMAFIDECGSCVAAGSDPAAAKDFCGICNGGNATKNQCDECEADTVGWTRGLDGCGKPICKNLPCSENCDGIEETILTRAREPNCDMCRDINESTGLPEPDPKCVQDCNGIYYYNEEYIPDAQRSMIQGEPTHDGLPPNELDECNICVPRGTRSPNCITYCDGQYYDKTTSAPKPFVDNCGQCVVPGVTEPSCQQDCAQVWYGENEDPEHLIDFCDECHTIADQNSTMDMCGRCINAPGYVDNCILCNRDFPDDSGTPVYVPSPETVTDVCGDCYLLSDLEANPNIRGWRASPCSGCLPDGPANPSFNDGVKTDTNGTQCPCFTDPVECPTDGNSYCFDDDCPAECAGYPDVNPDACGRCPDDPGYEVPLDSCGQCCDGPDHQGEPILGLCNRNLDDCGQCFQNNILKSQNPCGLCVASECQVDCNGNPYVNGEPEAMVDCNGVCRVPGECYTNANNYVPQDPCPTPVTNGMRESDLARNFPGPNNCDACGNGLTDPWEACDPTAEGYTTDSCNADCSVAQSALTPAAITGIVAAVVGAVVLVAAAIAGAVAYAFSTGMLGSAFTKVDLGAANNNPMYDGQEQIKSNPLYVA